MITASRTTQHQQLLAFFETQNAYCTTPQIRPNKLAILGFKVHLLQKSILLRHCNSTVTAKNVSVTGNIDIEKPKANPNSPVIPEVRHSISAHVCELMRRSFCQKWCRGESSLRGGHCLVCTPPKPACVVVPKKTNLDPVLCKTAMSSNKLPDVHVDSRSIELGQATSLRTWF